MELANTLKQDGESRGGVLAHLERLETQVSKPHKNLEEPQDAQALEAKIHELERLRDNLRAEVKQRQARVKASTASVEPDQTLEISEQEILERKQENVKAILQAYRFTEEISAKYLQTNTQHFLFVLCEYLNAYSGRKYQADRLQSDFAAFLVGPLQRNSLCNLLSFTYKVKLEGQSFPFCARLLYKDLTTTLPTDVTVTSQEMEALPSTWEEQRADHENLFFTKPLHQVFTSFARKGEKLDISLLS
ncbi:CENPO [Cervus elaphus hippelaphus]|uniref:Centromere protein O n=1 Tax=Cervus elaphus hippelaphus TaxID=46360 RepID=A0A212CXD1_CEREH|nr:CENPO [Cervus elaphus hippelaphus]